MDVPENDWLIACQKMLTFMVLCSPCRQKDAEVSLIIFHFYYEFKIEETPEGGVKITRELCKNCKTGNKVIGAMIRNVQYGKGPRKNNQKKGNNNEEQKTSCIGNEEILEKTLEIISEVNLVSNKYKRIQIEDDDVCTEEQT